MCPYSNIGSYCTRDFDKSEPNPFQNSFGDETETGDSVDAADAAMWASLMRRGGHEDVHWVPINLVLLSGAPAEPLEDTQDRMPPRRRERQGGGGSAGQRRGCGEPHRGRRGDVGGGGNE